MQATQNFGASVDLNGGFKLLVPPEHQAKIQSDKAFTALKESNDKFEQIMFSAMDAGIVGASLAYNLKHHKTNYKDEGSELPGHLNEQNIEAFVKKILYKRYIAPKLKPAKDILQRIKNRGFYEPTLAALMSDIIGFLDLPQSTKHLIINDNEFKNILLQISEKPDADVDEAFDAICLLASKYVLPPLSELGIMDKKNWTYFNGLIYIEFSFETRDWMFNTYDKELAFDFKTALSPVRSELSVRRHQVIMTAQGPTTSSSYVDFTEQLMPKNCFYPNFKNGMDKLLDDFMASNAALLFIYGPPGTGKTTLLRQLMVRYGVEVFYSTTPMVFAGAAADATFRMFQQHAAANIFFAEEMDAVLGPRTEGDGNLSMSSILNALDGIASTGRKKKMVICCNVTDLNKVDEALIRPGRCHDKIYIGALNSDQAKEIYEEMKEESPETYICDLDIFDSKDKWTLAEVLSVQQEASTPERSKANRIGFGT